MSGEINLLHYCDVYKLQYYILIIWCERDKPMDNLSKFSQFSQMNGSSMFKNNSDLSQNNA